MAARSIIRAVCWGQLGFLALLGSTFADDLDRAEPYRTEVNGAIDVLAASQATPSSACSSALDEMQTTDNQLKALTGQLDDSGEAPQALEGEKGEVGIGRDVLASDLQTAVTDCRPDAERVCASTSSVKVAKLCEAFAHDMKSDRPARR